MKIANADKLKHHFETVVSVKLFTVPEILTIIDTFSVEVPEDEPFSVPGRAWAKGTVKIIRCFLHDLFSQKPIGGTKE